VLQVSESVTHTLSSRTPTYDSTCRKNCGDPLDTWTTLALFRWPHLEATPSCVVATQAESVCSLQAVGAVVGAVVEEFHLSPSRSCRA
jgi:hypothetical protein